MCSPWSFVRTPDRSFNIGPSGALASLNPTLSLCATMTTNMGPPPPRNPNVSTEPELITQEESEPTTVKTSRDPPQKPPVQEKESTSDSEPNSVEKPSSSELSSVPYAIPQWSEPPSHHFFLEVLEDGCVIDQLKVYEKGAYMFGSVDLCDVVLEHPSISRFHAVLQFRSSGQASIYDLGSKHGTSINKSQVTRRTYMDLHVGDVIQFGHSSRLYIFQGPSELMPLKRNQNLGPAMADKELEVRDELAESLNDLFSSLSTMVKSELQGTNNILELLEKMNLKVAEEYKGFGDVASGLRVFVEQLKNKSGNFDEYVQQIDTIEQQVTEFEAVISVLDRYVSLLECKVQSVYQHPPP